MQCASIVGLAVVGGMVASMVSITTPLAFHAGGTELVLQDMLDTMFPKLLPLLGNAGDLQAYSEESQHKSAFAGNCDMWNCVGGPLGIL